MNKRAIKDNRDFRDVMFAWNVALRQVYDTYLSNRYPNVIHLPNWNEILKEDEVVKKIILSRVIALYLSEYFEKYSGERIDQKKVSDEWCSSIIKRFED